MMKITLLHPSRGRAQKAFSTFNYWKQKMSGKHTVEHILSLDNDDPGREEYIRLFGNSRFILSDNTCVVEATNKAAIHATGEVLIYLSDDFKCPQDWDDLIAEHFKNIKGPGLLKVDDCLQKFSVAVLTIPVMNVELYNRLGYFWHPGYRSMFVDEHLFWICNNNKWLYLAPELKFPHEHCCNGMAENDETYKRSALNWDQGKALFEKHKKEGFPL